MTPKKVLLTGMTSAQCNPQSHERSTTFAGLIRDTLVSQGHEVFWMDPEVWWTCEELEGFDHVLVGLSPLTGLPANRAYGALNLVQCLRDDPRLVLYFDAHSPSKIWDALRAVVKNADELVKPFYDSRKGILEARAPAKHAELVDAVHFLASGVWPTTIYPALPWHHSDRLIGLLPPGAYEKLVPINLDGLSLSTGDVRPHDERSELWTAEKGSNDWLKRQSLNYDVVPLTTQRLATNTEAIATLTDVIGMLLPPWRDGTWWSPRIAQALSVGTPVVTEWREAQKLSEAWSFLPGKVEDLPPTARHMIVEMQQETYANAVQSGPQNLTDALEGTYAV